MIIGITGPTGAGKTTVLNVLKTMRFAVFDCDEIYHWLLDNSIALKSELTEHFSDCITDGRIDRRKLASVVFNDEGKLHLLNGITHTAVKNELIMRLDLLPKDADAAIDAFALREGGLDQLCDLTIAVLASNAVRTARIIARDGISAEEACKRIASQKPDEFYINSCDRVIVNNYASEEEFSNFCADYFRALKEEK